MKDKKGEERGGGEEEGWGAGRCAGMRKRRGKIVMRGREEGKRRGDKEER